MKDLVEIYCFVDNFVKMIDQRNNKKMVGRKGILTKSDYVTLGIFKQQYGITTTKKLYLFVKEHMKQDFPNVPSYQQFNHGIKSTSRYFVTIAWLLTKMTYRKDSKYHIVDSSPMPVCNNQYRHSEKTFKGFASTGKNLNGWFWGFKLHIIINDNMEIEAVKITDGSTRDLDVLDGDFIEGIRGWLVGDKGYIGKKKTQDLSKKGIHLLTKPRKNMKKRPATNLHNFLLSMRQSIESVFSYLKHRLSLVSRFARSPEGFFANAFSAIVTYIIDSPKKTKTLSLVDYSSFLIS